MKKADSNPSNADKNRVIQTIQTKLGWPRHEAVIWFHTKSPKLGGRSPKDLIEAGKIKRVLTYIDELK